MPNVAIIDWKTAPIVDGDISVERAVIGDAANVTSHMAEGEADMPAEAFAADVLVLWHNLGLSREGIARMERCRAIIRNGVGFDSVDIRAAAECGIPVCNVPDYGTEEVADHTLALALALARQVIPLDAQAKALRWEIPEPGRMRRLRGRRFGIVGLGRIGTAAALRAKAFGMDVVFYDPYLPNGVHKALGVRRARTLDELVAQTDILSIHCPLNDETRHLIAERELALLPAGAFLVNTARGAIVKKEAVLNFLRQGRLAGAGLDVVEDEPLKMAEEAATPNLIVTCHAAFCSVESKLEMRETSARIARAAVLREPLENVVNGV